MFYGKNYTELWTEKTSRNCNYDLFCYTFDYSCCVFYYLMRSEILNFFGRSSGLSTERYPFFLFLFPKALNRCRLLLFLIDEPFRCWNPSRKCEPISRCNPRQVCEPVENWNPWLQCESTAKWNPILCEPPIRWNSLMECESLNIWNPLRICVFSFEAELIFKIMACLLQLCFCNYLFYYCCLFCLFKLLKEIWSKILLLDKKGLFMKTFWNVVFALVVILVLVFFIMPRERGEKEMKQFIEQRVQQEQSDW